MDGLTGMRVICGPYQSQKAREYIASRRADQAVLLKTLKDAPDGKYTKCYMLTKLLSIKKASKNPVGYTQHQKGKAHNSGTFTGHTRTFRFMCLLSPPGDNTFTVFQGGTFGSLLFNLDPRSRDNGVISESSSN